MTSMEELRIVKEKHEGELMNKDGVTGVAVGNKVIGGKKTEELSIVVYVIEKKPVSELKEEDVIPREIEGVRTDVVESGALRAL